MKWTWLKENKDFILKLILVIFIFLLVRNCDKKFHDKLPVEEVSDTVYNTVVLDSIKYNIIIKDSIITKIKYKYETEIIKVDNMSDSASVELFKRLCTDDSLYGGENKDR